MMRADAFFHAAEALSFADLTDLTGGRGLVVVAPHPDDESLGCGGLIAQACAQGVSVRLVVVSDGVGSHPDSHAYPPPRLQVLREAETLRAAEQLGLDADNVRFVRLPDRFVPSVGPDAERAALAIAAAARECDAGALFTTWAHDPHCDHTAAAAIARLAWRHLDGVRLYAYPIWGWTLPEDVEVGPPPRGARLDITAVLDAKLRAIAAHRSQTTDMIDDDPNGFRLDAAMLARFARPFEVFLDVDA